MITTLDNLLAGSSGINRPPHFGFDLTNSGINVRFGKPFPGAVFNMPKEFLARMDTEYTVVLERSKTENEYRTPKGYLAVMNYDTANFKPQVEMNECYVIKLLEFTITCKRTNIGDVITEIKLDSCVVAEMVTVPIKGQLAKMISVYKPVPLTEER